MFVKPIKWDASIEIIKTNVKNVKANNEIIWFPKSKFILMVRVNLVTIKRKPIPFWNFFIEMFDK
jgi:hypothetical protein